MFKIPWFHLAGEVPPEELIKLLNEYFELVVDVIFEFEGTLDKFMGDGIMAIWGAPMAVEESEKKAAMAAVKIQQTMQQFNTLGRMDGPSHRHGDRHRLRRGPRRLHGLLKDHELHGAGSLREHREPPVLGSEQGGSRHGPLYHATSDSVVGEQREALTLKGISKPVPAWNIFDLRSQTATADDLGADHRELA